MSYSLSPSWTSLLTNDQHPPGPVSRVGTGAGVGGIQVSVILDKMLIKITVTGEGEKSYFQVERGRRWRRSDDWLLGHCRPDHPSVVCWAGHLWTGQGGEVYLNKV